MSLMSNGEDPPALALLLADCSALVRRAYAEGYRVGTHEAVDRMARAASYGAGGTLTAIGGGNLFGSRESGQGPRMSPPRSGLPHTARSHKYGSVIGLCRQALLAAPNTGLTKEEFIEYCRSNGSDVTPDQIKDVIKRLIGSEEAERVDGVLYPGRRLQPFIEEPTARLKENGDTQ